jgi:hypothetical protein
MKRLAFGIGILALSFAASTPAKTGRAGFWRDVVGVRRGDQEQTCN